MPKRPAFVAIGALLVALAAAALYLRSGTGPGSAQTPAAAIRAAAETTGALAPGLLDGAASPAPPGSQAAAAPDGTSGDPEGDPESAPDPDWESALRWSMVDLDAVRAALPDNLYWKMSVPTKDPETLEWRQRERARWNEDYGRVLSGTATHEQVHAYYELRERISEDAVLFSDHLIQNYGDVLPERDLGLLYLARKLHMARLEEMPRRLAEALERSTEHAALREAWLADEEAFEAALRHEP